MSGSKIAAQRCAICERERRQSLQRSISTSSLDLGETTAAKLNNLLNNKYRNLPGMKTDDFCTQVTEPQWLRRGNLRETDSVCKRHLAVLMRGADRGSEGGCCSPLHRGARLCKSGSLKRIPPTWKKLFMKHPMIKDEDKDNVMMFCWDCYKKHMNRMSKYGDPVGKPQGPNQAIHRSNSTAESDGASSGSSNAFHSIKRHKSMDKLTFGQYSYNSLNRRRSSASSLQNEDSTRRYPRYSDSETRSSTVKRTARGRRSNRGRRSPSPPNNISPVRTSVVHSKRKHSPHKPPSSWRRDINSKEAGRIASTNNRQGTDNSLNDPPVPPPGLFSPRVESGGNPVDIFNGRNSEDNEETKTDNFDIDNLPPPPPEMTAPYQDDHDQTAYMNAIINGFHYDVRVDDDVLTESLVMQQLSAPRLAEESTTTSADEIAAIFANQIADDEFYETDDNNNTKNDEPVKGASTVMIPQFIDLSDDTSDISTIPPVPAQTHQHQSSSGSSDRTGDTQIELDDFDIKDSQDASLPPPSDHSYLDTPEQTDDNSTNGNSEHSQMKSEQPNENPKPPEVTATDFSNAVFLSPNRQHSTATSDDRSISYHLSPQSPGRLESIKLEFSEDVPADVVDEPKLYFDGDARERSHPLRNNVFLKIPRELDAGWRSRFAKVSAEDVEIFPDTMSFLDGITQTVGEDMTMYKQDGPSITNVDLRLSQNREAHRTAPFSCESLVVRRGQPFEVFVTLDEEFDENVHRLMLELTFGASPKASNGTHVFVPVQLNGCSSSKYGQAQGGQWSGYSLSSDDPKCVKVSVTSPFTAAIGSYNIHFQIEKHGYRSRWLSNKEFERRIILLFNPWNIDDAVFMSSQSDRGEYVMADCGCIFTGNLSNPIALPWIYGQYEPGVLAGCMEMLERANMSMVKQGDPAAVAKALCVEISNSQKRKSTCHSQSASTIFTRYLDSGSLHIPRNNKELSALIVSMFRCVGLPARATTCYNYAAKTDIPMLLNAHVSEDGQMLDQLNTDQLWPSFSWCGVWMSRVDLPPGFGGWQAVLPPRDGCNATGPIPAYAIKKGQTSCCDGIQDHFAALNAEKKSWLVSRDGSMEPIDCESNTVGSAIVSKSVANLEPQDVTKLYKFPFGSEEQKLALNTALLHYGSREFFEKPIPAKALSMSLSTNPTVINLGTEVEVVTSIKSTVDVVSHITINLDAVLVSEDGTPELKLNRETILAEVLPNESVEVPVKVSLSPCIHKLSHYRHLKFSAFGTIREKMDQRSLISSHIVGINYPSAEIQLHGEFRIGGEVTVITKVRNPFPYRLQNAKVAYLSSGLIPLDIVSKSGISVGPWQVFKAETLFRCQRSGKHTIRASFSSDLLDGLVGIQQLDIT